MMNVSILLTHVCGSICLTFQYWSSQTQPTMLSREQPLLCNIIYMPVCPCTKHRTEPKAQLSHGSYWIQNNGINEAIGKERQVTIRHIKVNLANFH